MTFLKKLKHSLFLIYIIICRIYRNIFNRPIIYVFGDSHVNNFHDALFRTTHVGPATAHNLILNNSTTLAKKKIQAVLQTLESSQKHYLLFIFGEIDCRIHINKVSKIQHVSLESVIDSTVSRYINYLIGIKKQLPNSVIMLLNVLPAGSEKNIYNTKFYPSRSLHQKIVRLFNEKLNLGCKKNNFIFISVFDELIDQHGERIQKYVFDDVHYNRQAIQFIRNEIFRKVGIS